MMTNKVLTLLRAAGALLLAASALLLLAQPASAQKPDTFRAGTLCDFEVSLVLTGAQPERETLPSGVIVFSGRSTLTVTNEDTQVSRTYNISGPSQYDPATNRVTLLGPSVVLEPKRDGFIIYTQGQTSFVLNEPIEEQVGNQTDICADLA
jgi:hypothetical protein